jgi:hypothetical protein
MKEAKAFAACEEYYSEKSLRRCGNNQLENACQWTPTRRSTMRSTCMVNRLGIKSS